MLVMHSYGGAPGSCVAVGTSEQDLHARSEIGGITGLIYLTGLCLERRFLSRLNLRKTLRSLSYIASRNPTLISNEALGV